eukprot:4597860-Alexandrium_andersonii.AAC.1
MRYAIAGSGMQVLMNEEHRCATLQEKRASAQRPSPCGTHIPPKEFSMPATKVQCEFASDDFFATSVSECSKIA